MPTPNLQIPYVPEGTLDPAAGLNLALNMLDALTQVRVINMTTNTPPATPADGDLYIVGPSPTGAWAGRSDDLARYVSVGAYWQFYTAGVSVNIILNNADGTLYIYDMSSSPAQWVAAAIPEAPIDGQQYARSDGAWEVVTGGGGGGSQTYNAAGLSPTSNEVTLDMTTHRGFYITLDEDLSTTYVTNFSPGANDVVKISVLVEQDGTGGWTASFPFIFAGGTYTPTAAAGAVDLIEATYFGSLGQWYAVAHKNIS